MYREFNRTIEPPLCGMQPHKNKALSIPTSRRCWAIFFLILTHVTTKATTGSLEGAAAPTTPQSPKLPDLIQKLQTTTQLAPDSDTTTPLIPTDPNNTPSDDPAPIHSEEEGTLPPEDPQDTPAHVGMPLAPSQVVIPPFTKSIPQQPNTTAARLQHPTIGCTDILMQSQCFIDPSIKVAYTYVYTLCLMEFSLQTYLKSQRYMAKSVRTLEEPAQTSLKEVQRVLPSAILGYKLISELFQGGQLRDILDSARLQYQDLKQLNQ